MSNGKKKTETNLPPSGYKRDEELKKRTDELQQKAEEASKDTIAIDPKKMEIDREMQMLLRRGDGAIQVSNAQPGFHYVWAAEYNTNKIDIVNKMRVGYEVVQGNDPEAREYQDVDTKRRMGDVILMRIPDERYAQIQAHEYEKANRYSGYEDSELNTLIAKSGGLLKRAESPVAIRREAIRTQAIKGVDQMLRNGTVPGLDVPGGD